MKKWKCTVCGYIYEGPTPPQKCPRCGAPAAKFVELTDEAADGQAVAVATTAPAAAAPATATAATATAAAPATATAPAATPIDAGVASTGKSNPAAVVAPAAATPTATAAAPANPAAAPAAAAPAAPLPLPDPNAPAATAETTADVLVVGSGAAAFSAAITARAAGLSVIMLEKSATIGGTTRRSGAGFWTPMNRHQAARGIVDNRDDAIRYMCRLSYPHLYDATQERYGLTEHEFKLIEAFADNAHKMVDFIEELGVFETTEEINWLGLNPVDYQSTLPENKGVRGRTLYPKDDNGNMGYGDVMIERFKAYAREHGIFVNTAHTVTRILRDSAGAVTGLIVEVGGAAPETKQFTARQAVVFGTGGYTHNEGLVQNFQRGPIYGGCSTPECTGDFVSMGARIGAQLGNMQGAFRAQCLLENKLDNPYAANNCFFIAGDSVFIVNKYGRRVLNEKRDYNDRGMVHFAWDQNKGEWTNQLLFLIADQRAMELWDQYPPYALSGADAKYMIKGETLDDLAANITARIEGLASAAGSFRVDPGFAAGLHETFERFNGFARAGHDADFQRGDHDYDLEWGSVPPTLPGIQWPEDMDSNYALFPLSQSGPYYAAILGVEHAGHQRRPGRERARPGAGLGRQPDTRPLRRRQLHRRPQRQRLLGRRRHDRPGHDLWLPGRKTHRRVSRAGRRPGRGRGT